MDLQYLKPDITHIYGKKVSKIVQGSSLKPGSISGCKTPQKCSSSSIPSPTTQTANWG